MPPPPKGRPRGGWVTKISALKKILNNKLNADRDFKTAFVAALNCEPGQILRHHHSKYRGGLGRQALSHLSSDQCLYLISEYKEFSRAPASKNPMHSVHQMNAQTGFSPSPIRLLQNAIPSYRQVVTITRHQSVIAGPTLSLPLS